jgi:hypothetical protein
MLALTIVPPRPLSSELNAERVIDSGFHSGGANEREAFIYKEFSFFSILWQLNPPLIHYTTNNITKCTS